jgi:hypothetical protein
MGIPDSSRLLVGLLCVALLSPIAATTADAQSRRAQTGGWRGGPDRDLYERGYRDGLRQGEQDARQRRAFDLGRNANYGARDDFRRGFADGYRVGFERASVRASRQPDNLGRDRIYRRGSGGFQEAASARGFSDGYERGLNDGRDRDRYDPVGSRDYRDGDNGYSGSYGSRDAYKNNYRAGFRQGYEEGYRDSAHYRR